MRGIKAVNLLNLAICLSGCQLSLKQISDKYGVERRSAQRMLEALETIFGDRLVHEKAEDNKTRLWRLTSLGDLSRLAHITKDEALALQNAMKAAKGRLPAQDLRSLDGLVCKLRAAMDHGTRRKYETDLAALMEAEGIAYRPGPRLQLREDVLPTIRDAILSNHRLKIVYAKDGAAKGKARVVEPYGILYGQKPFMVASLAGENGHLLWRVDRISQIKKLEEPFTATPFSLKDFSSRCFGIFVEEPFDVEWEFSREVADSAEKYTFHPDQIMRKLRSGALRVSFHAGGALEMYWHLVQWAGCVKVLKPVDFKERVIRHVNGKFFQL